MWQCGNVTPSERHKPCSENGLLPRSNIASVAMLLGMVAMLLIDPRADLPRVCVCVCGLCNAFGKTGGNALQVMGMRCGRVEFVAPISPKRLGQGRSCKLRAIQFLKNRRQSLIA